MAFIMRSLICNKIVEAVSGFPIRDRGIQPSQLLPFVKICRKSTPTIEYQLQLIKDNHAQRKDRIKETQIRQSLASEISSLDISQLIEKIQTDSTVTAAYYEDASFPKIKLKVCNRKLLKEVLNLVCDHPESFWKSSALFTLSPKQKVIVEFSSPNIAKPFHMGHLRSTFIGNFISNLHEALGHEVVRINYLGDWGMQFGFLKHGYDLKQMSEKDLEKDSIKSLYNLYVWVNEESQKSEKINEEAKNIFNLMEKGDDEQLKTWKLFRDLSIKDLKRIYRRLNVNFDEYHGESMYHLKESNSILQLMEEKGILKSLPDGRSVYVWKENPPVTIVKSDGSTLYLTRDIAAALHRFNMYKFDKMFYVVDNSQYNHFLSLIRILTDLGFDWAKNMQHVKFGRILGMSTRKGTAVFLEDVLDEAQDLSITRQKESKNTPFDDPLKGVEIADIVGASGMITADLRRRRKKDYTFSWENALRNDTDTGARLQYVHCRLVQLEMNCGVAYKDVVNMESLVEPEVIDLVRYIARFDEVLQQTYEEIESSILVIYLFELCTAINKAYKVLPVKNVSPSTAEDRIKLFRAARHTLAAGMRVLGLQPLDQM